MKIKRKREFNNILILWCIISSFFLASIILTTMVYGVDGSLDDLTENDAESEIIAFMPFADSGLQTLAINNYPQKELLVSYDGASNIYESQARVNFKVGEWRYIGDNNESREVFTVDNDTKLIKSEFWFETDVIAWTDLEYEDVFYDDQSPVEIQKELQWLYFKKRYNWGVDILSLNSIFRISAWNHDLYDIYSEVGNSPSDLDLVPWVNQWVYQGKDYWCTPGLQQLLADPIKYMPEHYNKYLKWNQLNFPGNPTNMRDFSLNKFNDLKINGDLILDVNMQESFWNSLKYQELVEVRDGGTGEVIGAYDNDKIVFSIDNMHLIGPGDPNHPDSRTRVVDLQELYDNLANTTYAPNTAEGNMISSTTDNQPQNTSTDVFEEIQDFSDPEKVRSLVPEDIIGDGSIVVGVVERTAEYSWNKNEVEQGPQATLLGTIALEPLIWGQDEIPSTITEMDLLNLKPLDQITLQDFAFGYELNDRDNAIFKVRFEFGPKLLINYATMNFQQIHLTMANGLLGGYDHYFSVTDISDLTHVPYSANVRNIGVCQTLKLKVVGLSTYDYIPYGASGDEVSPDFPLDDTEIVGPDEPETGGDTDFTVWEKLFDIPYTFLGFMMDLFGEFWWLFLILFIALIAVGFIVLKVVIKFYTGGPLKQSQNILKQLMSKGLESSKLAEKFKEFQGRVHHIEVSEKSKISALSKVLFIAISVCEVIFGIAIFMKFI